MIRSTVRSISLFTIVLAAATPAFADCPTVVTDALKKAFPDAKLTKCASHPEDGKPMFEALLARGTVKVEVDVSPTGEILGTEEPVAVTAVPAAVTRAFSAKYPKAKATKAEKMTVGTAVSYEVAFRVGSKTREATFKDDGTFVEEE